MIQINPNFIQYIANDLPAHLSMEDFIHYSSQPLRTSIRVNTLKISSADFIELMSAKGWQFSPIPWCQDGFWISIPSDIQLGNVVEHLQGLFYIQEASSMLPPTALFDHGLIPELVLDVASAPGSKTTQIAALMNNNGLLIANEYSSSRVKVLHANVQRMGVTNCALTHFDGRVFGEYLYESFDAILLDAPCGGEGTVRKDPDALKSWDIADVEAIATTQQALIESAFVALKPGGTLVYSTCTLNRRENQDICLHLINKYADLVEVVPLNNLFEDANKACTEEGFLHVWPQIYDSEGFFVAKFKKLGSCERQAAEPRKQKNFPFNFASRKQVDAINDYFSQQLGLNLPAGDIMTRDEEYWLFPKPFAVLTGKMRFQRIGLKLADTIKKGFKVRYEAIMAFGQSSTKTIELTPAQAQQYLMGRDISLTEPTQAQGEIILCLHGAPLGLAKHLGHRLKNSLPRELVHDNAISI
ncbi:16S rRNA (cytosine(1407)-C(5))-methyltransferase RsmF [Shewanella marina]|uniref:16S rRNA (cytosine(1407)-C(5))-methyltransferase RsmF n=1 Tax=Shewanella marina TaxID=487319 RepID=UPI00046FD158|nr:16S rRNA (cytosine(1407)-C(5))-methyltransferase RsmF [Shewanella marina]